MTEIYCTTAKVMEGESDKLTPDASRPLIFHSLVSFHFDGVEGRKAKLSRRLMAVLFAHKNPRGAEKLLALAINRRVEKHTKPFNRDS